MSIKCGHCQGRHTTVVEVKACSAPKPAKAPHDCEMYDGECMAFIPECPYYKPEYADNF